ncbi:ABC transporter substrate-binding protein [Rhodovibrio sodomensis]|uniref:ABC transporter substrate-binding protein n=1 Tax=Rhodovibrio sodomensis TaxID=1088 RepID=A0ABS1DJM4_9PROT|nr:ABC transporter substrate-binding protein [Rhodovibrio sodomensis]MBK1669693.1 ABC transporter substrate-binding protein [Rhodovibrio sodomensis]
MINRRGVLRSATAAIAAAAFAVSGFAGQALAQDKQPITFALLQDFTGVYTFVSNEYNQGQQDYIKMVNATGGVKGHPIELIVRDTGNEPQRGIEAYNRAVEEGAVLVDFLSTPVSRAMVPRVLEDEVVMITALHGRGDASDGQTFPYVFPMMATYWSQASVLAKYIEEHMGGLEGKKIAHVFIDSPFGREPLPILRELAERKGFEVKAFPYPSPGNEQSATWSDVRRWGPDHVTIWGAGGGQPVSIRTAIRNGISPKDILSVVWLARTDMRQVGFEAAKGVKRFAATATGRDTPVIQKIMETVIEKGNGTGDMENVGNVYYNIGVATMAASVQAAEHAIENYGAPVTGPKLKKGFEDIENFNAQGLMPPITITEKDHQGGGYGRVSMWTGDGWEPQTDWITAYQDIVWEEIEENAKQFEQGN